MTNQERIDESGVAGNKPANSDAASTGRFPANSDATKTGPAQNLTTEEQMALYEKALKEEDWGHQPC